MFECFYSRIGSIFFMASPASRRCVKCGGSTCQALFPFRHEFWLIYLSPLRTRNQKDRKARQTKIKSRWFHFEFEITSKDFMVVLTNFKTSAGPVKTMPTIAVDSEIQRGKSWETAKLRVPTKSHRGHFPCSLVAPVVVSCRESSD